MLDFYSFQTIVVGSRVYMPSYTGPGPSGVTQLMFCVTSFMSQVLQ